MSKLGKDFMPVSVAMPREMLDLIDQAMGLTGLAKQDIIRLAIRIGLEDLRRCNYNLASTVVDAVHRAAPTSGVGLNESVEDPPAAGSWRVSQVIGPSKYPAKKKAR